METARFERNPLIEIKNVFKTYPCGDTNIDVLKSISLTIHAGEFVGIVGPSGSGKTTLMNMITGIDRPSEGEVWIAGEPLHRLSENSMSIWRRQNVGVIFQFFQLLPSLSIIENVILPLDFSHMYSHNERRRRAMNLLEMVGIADQANKLPSLLSGGQQQRAAIARALITDPPLIIADEPTGNLDSVSTSEVFSLFTELANKGTTLVVITHNRELSARMMREITIKDGCIQDDHLN